MRKKMFASFLFLAVAMAVFLTGCGKGEGENGKKEGKGAKDDSQVMGRYVEEEWEFPSWEGGWCLGLLAKPEGGYEAYGYANETFISYASKDGTAWEEQELPSWLSFAEEHVQVGKLTQGEDGCLYALVDESGKQDGKSLMRQHVYRSKDGKAAEEVAIPLLSEVKSEEEDFILYQAFSDLQVMENGNIVAASTFGDNVLVFSPEGQQIGQLDIENPSQGQQYERFFTIKGNVVAGPGKNGKEIRFFDGKTLKETKSVEFPVSRALKIGLLSDGAAVIADKNGIHRLEPEGTLWQTVVDGELNSMSMPSMYINELVVLEGEEESYLVLYEGAKLYHYGYDASVAAVPESGLTVYSLRENATIRQAVALFQQEHKEVKVNYTVAMGAEDEDKKEDFIRAFHTELLDGNGADVICLDELPIASYQEKGILEDLSKIVDTADLLPLAVEGSKSKDGLYYLPMRFRICFLFGTKEAAEHSADLKELLSYVKENGNKDWLKQANRYDFLDYTLSMYKDELLDEQGAIKEAELKTLLEDMMGFFESSGMNDTEREDFGSKVTNENYRPMLFSGFPSFINGTAKACIEPTSDVSDIYMVKAFEEKVEGMEWEVFGNGLIATGRIGLNKQAKNQEMAAEFVKFLFGETVQETDVYDGMPINLKAIDARVKEEVNELMTWGTSDMDENGNMVDLMGSAAPKEVKEKAVEKIKKADRLSCNQDALYRLMFDEIAPLLKGEKDVAQTVEAVKQKVNTYTAE